MTESEALQAFRDLFMRANDAWNAGDFQRAYGALSDDFEYNLAPVWPRARELRGGAEVVRFFEDFHETFPDVTAGPPEFVEAGELHLVVGIPVVGTGRASGARVEMEIWQVWELTEEGTPARVHEYVDRDAALRAAGVVR